MAKKLSNEIVWYRTCFSTGAGKMVLADLLASSGYFDTDLKTEGEVAVQNFTKRILKKMGIGTSPTKAQEYVDNLFNLKIG